MNTRLISLACAAGLAVPMPAKDETPLGKQMEIFNDVYKAFKREADPSKGAALAREAQETMVKAMSEIPDMVKKMPDGPEKAMASAEYRKMIGQAFVSLCEVEEAFLAGKIDDVEKIVVALKLQKKSGHDKFMEEE